MSICDPKDSEREEKEGGKEARKDSIMVPAINFARRMSMKITGGAGPLRIVTKVKNVKTNFFLTFLCRASGRKAASEESDKAAI